MEDQVEKLNELLNQFSILDSNSRDAICHSLIDMYESFLKIYSVILPELITKTNEEEIFENLLDIKEELRHIDYHIHDAFLPNSSDEGLHW